jgi:hypothetical protein
MVSHSIESAQVNENGQRVGISKMKVNQHCPNKKVQMVIYRYTPAFVGQESIGFASDNKDQTSSLYEIFKAESMLSQWGRTEGQRVIVTSNGENMMGTKIHYEIAAGVDIAAFIGVVTVCVMNRGGKAD